MARALLREPDLVNRLRDRRGHEGAVRPLQQVHADDLQRHPLRARAPDDRPGHREKSTRSA